MPSLIDRLEKKPAAKGAAERGVAKAAVKMPAPELNQPVLPEDLLQKARVKKTKEAMTLIHELHSRLVAESKINLGSAGGYGVKPDPAFVKKIQTEVARIIKSHETEHGLTWSQRQREALLGGIVDEIIGLGPIEQLIQDATITEVMVNGPDKVYIERAGKLTKAPAVFLDNAHVKRIIDKIVAPLGRRIDENSPLVDARLPDGSRVNAIIPPLALAGPTITIRKFAKEPFMEKDLIGFGSLNKQIAEFLRACVIGRVNLIVSGGTGSGKTTFLNVLSSYIPDDERIITIEDAAELQLRQEHVISLESRPAGIEGRGAITIREMVRNALRMRPQRIVVGECRGGEALDMLQAMNTGHDGSMTTGHANSPRDIISRLETMVLMSGVDLPLTAIREQIAGAVNLVVHQSRFVDGTRKITQLSELLGLDERGDYLMKDIFIFKQEKIDEKGKVIGSFQPTGYLPRFLGKIENLGVKAPKEMFSPKTAAEKLWPISWAGRGLGKRLQSLQGQAKDPYLELRLVLHQRLLDKLGASVVDWFKDGQTEEARLYLMKKIKKTIEELVGAADFKVPAKDREKLITEVINEVIGYGPIDSYLKDGSVMEIMVNGPSRVYIRRGEKLQLTPAKFRDEVHLRRVIDKIVSTAGRRVDEVVPMTDARLPDGSGVHVVIPPISLTGSTLTIRKFFENPPVMKDLLGFGTLDERMARFIEACVRGRLNIIVFGGSGSGKTTLLNVLSCSIPASERVVTIEDTAELRLVQDHVVPLESRPPNVEGKGAVTIRDLVKNALRMRPERIIVGEVRGAEALDMLQAMNTGHDGSLSTAHANSPHDMLSRLETMVLLAGMDLPIKAIREQVASAIDLLVQIAILADGSRKIVKMTEVLAVEANGNIGLADIFAFHQSGLSDQGQVKGEFTATGYQPFFLEKLHLHGQDLPEEIFRKGA